MIPQPVRVRVSEDRVAFLVDNIGRLGGGKIAMALLEPDRVNIRPCMLPRRIGTYRTGQLPDGTLWVDTSKELVAIRVGSRRLSKKVLSLPRGFNTRWRLMDARFGYVVFADRKKHQVLVGGPYATTKDLLTELLPAPVPC